MTTGNATSTRKALLALAVAVVALSIAALGHQVSAQAGSAGTGATGAYPWPVKPFTEQHPIRGYFGDPRTVFHGPQTTRSLMAGDGTFSFHQGVDISAPDGSPVYPVASGRVTLRHANRVTVDSGRGRAFQYWHIVPTVRRGQRVVAGRTVLGHIQEGREHVHLTHVQNGRVVNPLAPGRLTPYRDRTTPQIRLAAVRQVARGSKRVHFLAEAVDWPALPVPGRWHGYPVTPARITWRIERGGRVVVPTRVARDVRETVPPMDRFWATYARGSHQNWPVFAKVKIKHLAGRYLFKLTAKPFDSATLCAGTYELIVTARDTAGNRDAYRATLVVRAASVEIVEH